MGSQAEALRVDKRSAVVRSILSAYSKNYFRNGCPLGCVLECSPGDDPTKKGGPLANSDHRREHLLTKPCNIRGKASDCLYNVNSAKGVDEAHALCLTYLMYIAIDTQTYISTDKKSFPLRDTAIFELGIAAALDEIAADIEKILCPKDANPLERSKIVMGLKYALYWGAKEGGVPNGAAVPSIDFLLGTKSITSEQWDLTSSLNFVHNPQPRSKRIDSHPKNSDDSKGESTSGPPPHRKSSFQPQEKEVSNGDSAPSTQDSASTTPYQWPSFQSSSSASPSPLRSPSTWGQPSNFHVIDGDSAWTYRHMDEYQIPSGSGINPSNDDLRVHQPFSNDSLLERLDVNDFHLSGDPNSGLNPAWIKEFLTNEAFVPNTDTQQALPEKPNESAFIPPTNLQHANAQTTMSDSSYQSSALKHPDFLLSNSSALYDALTRVATSFSRKAVDARWHEEALYFSSIVDAEVNKAERHKKPLAPLDRAERLPLDGRLYTFDTYLQQVIANRPRYASHKNIVATPIVDSALAVQSPPIRRKPTVDEASIDELEDWKAKYCRLRWAARWFFELNEDQLQGIEKKLLKSRSRSRSPPPKRKQRGDRHDDRKGKRRKQHESESERTASSSDGERTRDDRGIGGSPVTRQRSSTGGEATDKDLMEDLEDYAELWLVWYNSMMALSSDEIRQHNEKVLHDLARQYPHTLEPGQGFSQLTLPLYSNEFDALLSQEFSMLSLIEPSSEWVSLEHARHLWDRVRMCKDGDARKHILLKHLVSLTWDLGELHRTAEASYELVQLRWAEKSASRAKLIDEWLKVVDLYQEAGAVLEAGVVAYQLYAARSEDGESFTSDDEIIILEKALEMMSQPLPAVFSFVIHWGEEVEHLALPEIIAKCCLDLGKLQTGNSERLYLKARNFAHFDETHGTAARLLSEIFKGRNPFLTEIFLAESMTYFELAGEYEHSGNRSNELAQLIGESDIRRTLLLAESALESFAKCDEASIPHCLVDSANIIELYDTVAAETVFTKALRLFSAERDLVGMATCLQSLANNASSGKHPNTARSEFLIAEAIHHAVCFEDFIYAAGLASELACDIGASDHKRSGLLLIQAGDWYDAEGCTAEAARSYSKAGAFFTASSCCFTRGEQMYMKAVRLFRDAGYDHDAADCLVELASASVPQSQIKAAGSLIDAVVAYFDICKPHCRDTLKALLDITVFDFSPLAVQQLLVVARSKPSPNDSVTMLGHILLQAAPEASISSYLHVQAEECFLEARAVDSLRWRASTIYKESPVKAISLWRSAQEILISRSEYKEAGERASDQAQVSEDLDPAEAAKLWLEASVLHAQGGDGYGSAYALLQFGLMWSSHREKAGIDASRAIEKLEEAKSLFNALSQEEEAPTKFGVRLAWLYVQTCDALAAVWKPADVVRSRQCMFEAFSVSFLLYTHDSNAPAANTERLRLLLRPGLESDIDELLTYVFELDSSTCILALAASVSHLASNNELDHAQKVFDKLRNFIVESKFDTVFESASGQVTLRKLGAAIALARGEKEVAEDLLNEARTWSLATLESIESLPNEHKAGMSEDQWRFVVEQLKRGTIITKEGTLAEGPLPDTSGHGALQEAESTSSPRDAQHDRLLLPSATVRHAGVLETLHFTSEQVMPQVVNLTSVEFLSSAHSLRRSLSPPLRIRAPVFERLRDCLVADRQRSNPVRPSRRQAKQLHQRQATIFSKLPILQIMGDAA